LRGRGVEVRVSALFYLKNKKGRRKKYMDFKFKSVHKINKKEK